MFPNPQYQKKIDRNAGPRVRVNIGGGSVKASHWQLMQRESAQVVGVNVQDRLCCSVLEPYSETGLGRVTGKVSGGVVGHLHGI